MRGGWGSILRSEVLGKRVLYGRSQVRQEGWDGGVMEHVWLL